MVALAIGAPESDLMTSPLPDCPSYKNMYSGFLDAGEGKEHHYVYIESAGNPETDPLLFWFNGGPGCSSMIGFIQEHGPCVFDHERDTIPGDNEYSWHYNASMVYIETPVGVGYNEQTRKYSYDDESVSYENIEAMKSFFHLYPELADKEIYLTGESYAGIYVPYLAKRMLEA